MVASRATDSATSTTATMTPMINASQPREIAAAMIIETMPITIVSSHPIGSRPRWKRRPSALTIAPTATNQIQCTRYLPLFRARRETEPRAHRLRRSQPPFRRIPAPHIAGRDVRAADPAIDAEELDTVGRAAKHALALGGETQRQPGEDGAVAERRGRR